MTLSPVEDLSIYNVALHSEVPPHPMQVSPSTLRSMMSAMIDLLVEQQISATLWVKIPRGEAWQSEIARYHERVGVPHEIYLCQHSKQELPEGTRETRSLYPASKWPKKTLTTAAVRWPLRVSPRELRSRLHSVRLNETDLSLISDEGVENRPETDNSPFFLITLPTTIQLRREYFLLVFSEQFCSAIIAHQPRSVQTPKLSEPESIENAAVITVATERKLPLLAVCSLDHPTMSQVLKGIKDIVLCYYNGGRDLATNPEILSENQSEFSLLDGEFWQRLERYTQHIPDPIVLSHLWAKQIQQHEAIWRRATSYRISAATAETLQAQNKELHHALREKDEFISNMSQELRTPVTNMKTALTLLNSPHLKPPQRQRYMQVLQTECDRQTSLINGLLDMVQLERDLDRLQMQPLRLIDIVPGVVSTYQPLAQEKGVMLAYTVPDDLPPVSCLSDWLKRIVINVLHNGIKFTPKGGEVWVRTKQQGDYVQLEFRDTGIGIPPREIPKIFDRFYRVRQPALEDTGGAGLGLAIVQQLLLHCGGSISVISKVGEGTVFNVLLPIYHPTQERSPNRPSM